MASYLGLRGSRLRTAIALAAGLCFVAFGYGQSDFGGLLTVSSFRERFPEIDTSGRPTSTHVAVIQGVTNATWNIGCFASAIIAVFLGDYLGRRQMIMLGLVLMAIGKVVQASSFSYGQLVAGRFIAGFGNGFNTAAVPAWQAESTRAHRRGTMLMVSSGACIAFGVALAYWITFAFAWLAPSSASWRVATAFQIVPAMLAFIMILFLPESPRWLILTGREEGALTVLSALSDTTPEDEEVRQEFLQIKDAILEMARGGFSSAFSMNEYRFLHRTILAFMLQVMQQWTGINIFTQYLALMFNTQTGYTPWVARLLAGCSATELFLASFVTVIGIDRFWGRRALSMFGAVGMSISLIVLTVMSYVDNSSTHIVMVVFIFVYNTFFAIGWQGMSWLWAVELTPLAIRGPTNALSTAGNWLSNFIVVLIAPIAFHHIGYRTYIIFAVINAAIVPIIYLFYPETGCRCLEEVDVLFHQASQTPSPWLSVVRVANKEPLWYGKGGENIFSYEQSEWHQHLAEHQRSSDEQTPSSSNGSPHGMEEKQEV
ncbi:sugar porter family MFS transporter [Aureobasidium pullulans]|nr:sugar porter family MFS transporter [Aureobasidium pullulans]THX78898.1 sugar porter family MFS transporter [Aureobasidium pullulans]